MIDHNDIYNELEELAVTNLKADAWLGDTDNVKTIQKKLSPNLVYYVNEVPVIAIEVMDVPDETNRNNSIFQEQINIICEVVCSGADRAELDRVVKEIIARIRRHVKAQIRAYSPANPFWGEPEIIPLGNGSADFITGENENSEYVQVGTTIIEIDIIDKS